MLSPLEDNKTAGEDCIRGIDISPGSVLFLRAGESVEKVPTDLEEDPTPSCACQFCGGYGSLGIPISAPGIFRFSSFRCFQCNGTGDARGNQKWNRRRYAKRKRRLVKAAIRWERNRKPRRYGPVRSEVRMARLNLGLSLPQAARRAGIRPAQAFVYERGELGVLTAKEERKYLKGVGL